MCAVRSYFGSYKPLQYHTDFFIDNLCVDKLLQTKQAVNYLHYNLTKNNIYCQHNFSLFYYLIDLLDSSVHQLWKKKNNSSVSSSFLVSSSYAGTLGHIEIKKHISQVLGYYFSMFGPFFIPLAQQQLQVLKKESNSPQSTEMTASWE